MTYNKPTGTGSMPHQQYLRNTVETATPLMLIIMLYDEAIKMCQLALNDMGTDKESVHNKLIKAQKIVTELTVSLNMDAGGEVAENLKSIYIYLHSNLVEANIENSTEKLEDVLKILKELRAAWNTVNQDTRRSMLQQAGGGISRQA